MQIVQQARVLINRWPYVPQDFSAPYIVALRTEANEVLTAYGLTSASPTLSKIEAFMDWGARTFVHPGQQFHINNSTYNLSVLPSGVTWTQYNTTIGNTTRAQADQDERLSWNFDPIRIIDQAFGVLNTSTGVRDNTGTMTKLGAAQWQIKSLAVWRSYFCTFQHEAIGAYLASLGIRMMITQVEGDNPCVFYIPELKKWVHVSSTFNEMINLDGSPASPVEFVAATTTGQAGRLSSRRPTLRPSWDAGLYIPLSTNTSYLTFNVNGFVNYGSYPDCNSLGGAVKRNGRGIVLDTPARATTTTSNINQFIVQPSTVAFPDLGVGLTKFKRTGKAVSFDLLSSWPQHAYFQRRINGGSWVTVGAADTLIDGTGTVEYRSVDVAGFSGMTAIVTL